MIPTTPLVGGDEGEALATARPPRRARASDAGWALLGRTSSIAVAASAQPASLEHAEVPELLHIESTREQTVLPARILTGKSRNYWEFIGITKMVLGF